MVISTHDTRGVTLRCLRAMQEEAQREEVAVRCILVDNASRDGTADAVDQLLPGVLVLPNARNVGYGEAANQGVRSGSGDYVLILNSDARPELLVLRVVIAALAVLRALPLVIVDRPRARAYARVLRLASTARTTPI